MEEKKNNNLLIIILTVLLVIAALVIGYLLGNNITNKNQIKENVQNDVNAETEKNNEESTITPVNYTPKCAGNDQKSLLVDIDETKYNNVVDYIKKQQNVKITVSYCDENSEKEIDGVAHFDLAEYTLTDSELNNSLNELATKKHSIASGGIGGGPCVPFTTISYTRGNKTYYIKYWGYILSESNDGNVYKLIDRISSVPEPQELCHYFIKDLGSTINKITKYER